MQHHPLFRTTLAFVFCVAFFTAGTAAAKTRNVALSLNFSSSVRGTVSSSSSAATTNATKISAPAPATTNTTINIPELPWCTGAKEDNALLWDVKSKKWVCKALSTLLPPKCTGADQALRFDGSAWKCETVGGLLVAHAVTFDDLNGKNTCDAANTWGGATCTVTNNGMGAKLACPANTLKVEVGALNSYELMTHDTNGIDKFGAEYHVFCYSRPTTIAK